MALHDSMRQPFAKHSLDHSCDNQALLLSDKGYTYRCPYKATEVSYILGVFSEAYQSVRDYNRAYMSSRSLTKGLTDEDIRELLSFSLRCQVLNPKLLVSP